MVDNGMYIQVLLQVLYQDQHQRQQDRLQHQGMDLNQDHLSAKPGVIFGMMEQKSLIFSRYAREINLT